MDGLMHFRYVRCRRIWCTCKSRGTLLTLMLWRFLQRPGFSLTAYFKYNYIAPSKPSPSSYRSYSDTRNINLSSMGSLRAQGLLEYSFTTRPHIRLQSRERSSTRVAERNSTLPMVRSLILNLYLLLTDWCHLWPQTGSWAMSERSFFECFINSNICRQYLISCFLFNRRKRAPEGKGFVLRTHDSPWQTHQSQRNQWQWSPLRWDLGAQHPNA